MPAIVVTGATGFLGTHLCDLLSKQGMSNVVSLSTQTGDLRDPRATRKIFRRIHEVHSGIDTVYHLAATVSGIGSISRFPATYFYDNMMIGLNVVATCAEMGVGKLVYAGSVCAYPEHSPVPMIEENIWDGLPEPSNLSYGVAKRAMITVLESYYRQYGLHCAYLMMANLYGPGDNTDPATSHVIPALIRKIYNAIEENSPSVEIWGSGNASRDFLYVGDAAKAFTTAATCPDVFKANVINIGSGEESSIFFIAKTIAELMGYRGTLEFDLTLPDGQKRRMLRLWYAHDLLHWKPETQLRYGLQKTIHEYSEMRRKGR